MRELVRLTTAAALLATSLCSARAQAPTPASVFADATPAENVTAPAIIPAPPNPLTEARKLLAVADYAAADRSLRDILQHAPDSGEAHFLLGFALLHEQKPAASLAVYSQGAKFKEPGPEELIGVASAYLQLQAYADAERWLREAAKRAPERPVIWYLLGRAQYSQALWPDAQRSFLSCLRLDPHHLRAQYNLGLADEMLHRPDEAAAAYRAAIAMQEASSASNSAKDVQPYLDLGMLLRRQSKAAEALPLLTVAAGNGSRDPIAPRSLPSPTSSWASTTKPSASSRRLSRLRRRPRHSTSFSAASIARPVIRTRPRTSLRRRRGSPARSLTPPPPARLCQTRRRRSRVVVARQPL